jgi:oligoendopeptidase F
MRPDGRWDLSGLFADDAAARAALPALVRDAGAFADRWADGDLAAALPEFDELAGRQDELLGYAYLRVQEDGGAEAADLDAATTAAAADVAERIAFVEDRIAALDEESAAALLASPAAAPWHEPIRRERSRPRLGPEAEAALRARDGAVAAWGELHARLLTGLVVEVDGEPHSYEGALSLVDRPERPLRRRARRALADAVEPRGAMLAACVDAVVVDRLAVSRLLDSSPLALAALEDGFDPETLQDVVAALDDGASLVHRLVALKARALGVPRLASFDLFAPVVPLPQVTVPEAVALIAAVAERAAPELGRRVEELFATRVDLAPRPGKGRTAAIGVSRRAAGWVLASFSGSVDRAASTTCSSSRTRSATPCTTSSRSPRSRTWPRHRPRR